MSTVVTRQTEWSRLSSRGVRPFVPAIDCSRVLALPVNSCRFGCPDECSAPRPDACSSGTVVEGESVLVAPWKPWLARRQPCWVFTLFVREEVGTSVSVCEYSVADWCRSRTGFVKDELTGAGDGDHVSFRRKGAAEQVK